MNKVFKVIWSEARNAYVVVSEIAKNHGSKSCSTKKLLTMLIATGVMTCASMAPAMAATNVDSGANVTVKKGATVTVAEKATVTVGDNAIALGKGAYAVKNSIAIGNGAYTQDGTFTKGQSVALGNGAVTGAKSTSIGSNAIGGREGTITIGANANNGSLYATIIGTDSKVNYMTRNSGAAATIVGAKSEIKNDNKSYSGVANGIFGSANTIENSNGVTIQGSGNTVTNAYKNMSGWDFNLGGVYVKKDAGAVGVIGGMNTVSNQIYTNVIGFGNTVAGDADNISHDVFVAGSRNNLSKVSDSIVMGNDNEISDRSNVISLGHENNITANNAVAIGNGASVSAEGGVALGIGSVADRANAVSVGSKDANRQIINVAAGTADTDAVNVSQLKEATANANKGWKLSTEGGAANQVASEATVDFSGKKDAGDYQNITVSNDGNNVKIGLASELHNVTGVVNGDSRVTLAPSIAGITNGQAQLAILGDSITLSKGVQGSVQIHGVAAGTADTDAVNFSQLNKAVAGVAKTEDVAVVYDKNKTSLRSTNATGVAENAIALGKGAYAVKNSIAIGNGAYTQDGTFTKGQSVALGNGAVTGAKSTSIGSNAIGGREGTITIGANANNGSLYATIIGTDSKVNYMTRNSGAAATIVGAKSEIKNDNKSYSGVANGIFGSANTIENSNGVTIQGSGNTVTNAYKNMSGWDFNLGGVYVKKDAGAVGVIGGMNTVSNQIYTNVIGFGNTVAGDADNISHDVFVAGSRNNLSKVSDSIVMGNDNEISDRSNVISLGHENNITANNAVAIGNGASVSAEGGVALGIGSVADRANAVSVGSKDANRQIINVAAGTADTDAVNVSQLKDVKAEALKHTQVKAGTNVGVVPSETEDGTHVYTVNADGTTVSGDSNVVVTAGEKDAKNVTNYGVKLNKDLKGIESVSNGSASLTLSSHPVFGATAKLTNGKASVELRDSTTIINGKVQVRQDGSIGGVTAGRVDNDAVNLGQLKDVKAEALKHTTLSDGKNTTVATTFKDGQTDYKVNVAGDLTDITSVVNGGAKLALNGAAGYAGIVNGKGASVYLQDGYTKINNQVIIDQDGKISGVAAGTADTDAVNYGQLKNISAAATAAKTEIKGGTNIANVDQTTADDGHMVYTVNANGTTVSGDSNVAVTAETKDNNVTNYAVKLNKDLKGIESVSNGSASLTMSSNPIFGATAKLTNGKASVELRDSTTIINGQVQVRQDGTIGGVTAGRSDKDAVNVSQLNNVKAEAGKHTTLSNGKNTTVEAAVKDGQTDYKVNVAGDLTDISSVANGDAKLALNGAAGTAGIVNGKGASVYMQDGYTVINSKVSFDQDGKISGVAAGVNNDDAVNVSQLKKVEEAAGNANKGWNLSTNGVATAATNVKPGDNVDFSGDKNVSVSNDGTAVSVKLNKNLKDIETISNGGATLTLGAMGGMVAELANGQGASVKLFGDTTTINGKVNVYKDGRIAGVADGVNATDAVNVSQLQKAAAASAATVTDGVNTTVTTTTAEDGHVDYKVNLNKNLTGVESISNGGASLTMNGFATELANGQGASVKLFGDTTTINGKVNVYKDGRIAGVADGVNANDAVNVSQLQKAAAASATTVSDGVNTTVTATKAEDGHTDYKVNLNKDLVGIESISNGDAKLTLGGFATELANGQGASVKLFGDTTTINNAVTVYKDGRIAGVANGINDNDAVNVGQLNKVSEIANKGWNLATNGVATEATNVKPGDYVDFSGDKNISVSHEGTKVKVELNKDLDVNSVQTNALNSKYNLSVGTMAENGIMPFFVNSTGAFYAAHNKFSVDKDGNMNANSVQTNALNSKYNLSVGTANENGTVPFFVNSNGAFYAANGKLVVDKDGKVTATAGEIGNVVLNNGVYTGHSALRDGELFVGDASGNYSQITTKGAKLGQVTIAADGKISGVAAGEVSSTSTDAINGSQLHQTNVDVAQNKADIAQNKADIAQNKADIAANRADIDKNKADIAANRADIDKNKADIAANRADIDKNKADIAQNKADIAQNKTDIKNLDNRVTNVEELAKKHTTVTAGDNITVTEDTNKDGGKEYKVALDKDIKLDSVTTGQTVMNNDGLKVGKDVSVTATAVTAGKTSISDEGVKVGDKTYISDKGLNANGQQITNVADGKENGDAVNYGQLKGVENQVISNTNRINQLGSRVNKVGAGAAALAALHPMDFDPDDKLTFSAGYGNYGGENAAAIGAYYRPDEKVMFSVGGTVGNGENMVNAGVSFSLDRTNHVSNSRTAMAREILDLRAEVTELKAMVAKGGLGSIAEDKMKIFPDVAENHWAYEYVGKLAAAGIIEGYPDGNFSGDRMMSRYEFAAMLYRAMQKGAQLDSKIINEFAPEMGRIRVDRISGEDGDRDKIERVRVNAVKGERDHYGNKIAKAEAKAK